MVVAAILPIMDLLAAMVDMADRVEATVGKVEMAIQLVIIQLLAAFLVQTMQN